MAKLRGTTTVWSGTSVGGTASSNEVYVGTAESVCVFIKNTGGTSATFKIQVSTPTGGGAGRNRDPVNWYDLTGQTAIVVASGASIAVNLAPFAPPYLRLTRTDAGAATTIDALVAGLD